MGGIFTDVLPGVGDIHVLPGWGHSLLPGWGDIHCFRGGDIHASRAGDISRASRHFSAQVCAWPQDDGLERLDFKIMITVVAAS